MGEWRFEGYKHGMAMVGLQWVYAANALLAKTVLTQGMSPLVFIVYRQAMATLALAPIALTARRRSRNQGAMGAKGFSMVFGAALIGSTLNQFFYYQGLQLTTSTMASAVSNLVPVITFVMAASIGLEKVQMRSIRSMAKIFGTITCVGGAVAMAVFRGPKLLNFDFNRRNGSFLHSKWEGLMIGFLFLMANSFCWSLSLILQVPICKSYLDPLSLATWMSFLSTFQSAILTVLVEPSLSIWKINSGFELFCCLCTGILGSGLTVCVQAWCISKRGPLFSAMFNPLGTVIVTVLASILLHEELYTGSLAGIAAVISGLYMVLWGKAKDLNEKGEENLKEDSAKITVTIDEHWKDCESNVEEPLLDGRANHESQMKEEEETKSQNQNFSCMETTERMQRGYKDQEQSLQVATFTNYKSLSHVNQVIDNDK